MSKPLPEQSNFIAIGAWNPAIIQPHWLKKHFPEQIPDTCKIEVASSGGTTCFRMDYEHVLIDPNNGRLVFIPKTLDETTMRYIADLASGVHDLLKHTPIVAAGCNFVFDLDSEESFTLDDVERNHEIADLYSESGETGQLISKSIRHTFGFADCSMNITYDYVGAHKVLRINFDYKGVRPVENAAQALVGNYKRSLALAAKLIRRR